MHLLVKINYATSYVTSSKIPARFWLQFGNLREGTSLIFDLEKLGWRLYVLHPEIDSHLII